jgi:hypothetical protein
LGKLRGSWFTLAWLLRTTFGALFLCIPAIFLRTLPAAFLGTTPASAARSLVPGSRFPGALSSLTAFPILVAALCRAPLTAFRLLLGLLLLVARLEPANNPGQQARSLLDFRGTGFWSRSLGNDSRYRGCFPRRLVTGEGGFKVLLILLVRKLVADRCILWEVSGIVANAPDTVIRGLVPWIGYQHDLHAVVALQVINPIPLLVKQVGSDIHRQLCDDLGRAFLACILANQPEHGE